MGGWKRAHPARDVGPLDQQIDALRHGVGELRHHGRGDLEGEKFVTTAKYSFLSAF